MMSQGIDPLHVNQVPSRRSQSKNDKYKDQSDMQNGLTMANFGTGPNGTGKLNAQAQVRTSQQNQRFTPMNMPGKGLQNNLMNGVMQKRSGGVNQSRDRSGVGFNSAQNSGLFNRPQSAT